MAAKFFDFRKLRVVLRKHAGVTCAVLLFVLFLVAGVAIYYSERQVDPSFSLFDAFTSVLVFLMGEYGEPPQTTVGKVLSIFLFVFGIVVVAAIIGKFASFFVELKREVRMPNELERHIVICNWNDKGDRIIRELHSPLSNPDAEIVVITDVEINEAELRMNVEYENVFFVRSDPTMHEVLKRARTQLARSVIILADPNHSDPDAKTALISLAITKLEKDLPDEPDSSAENHRESPRQRSPRIIAEVTNHRKIRHLKDAGVDEWVCAADYGLGIIAQCAFYGKLSEVYQQLLTYSDDTNEIYLVNDEEYPSSYLGKSFVELSEILNANRNVDNPVILLGVKRNDRIILNPREGEVDQLQEGDSLIVMSFDRPDLR